MIKSLKIYFTGLAGFLMLGAVVSSCEKSFDEKIVKQQDFTNSTIVQVINTVMNASRNYVYVDGKQLTGALMSNGSIFPTTGFGAVIEPGLRAFLIRDTLRTTTQVPLSFAANMQPGKRYTIFAYDTITSPKQKTVLDDIVIPEDSTTRLRLANFVYAPFAIPAVDVFSFVQNRNIFTNVAVTDVTAFIPYMSFTTDTLYFRDAGTTTTHLKVTLSGGLTTKRSYTLVYRGSYRGNTRTISLVASR